ncbi:MAG: glycosyltransferase family 2 protein [Gammaproteobacteria bacterium]
MQLSVVIPVFNEAENIEPLVKEIRAALDGLLEYEVIYVDDGSLDTTGKVLDRLRSEFSGLRVIRHRASCGQSTAIRTGVRAARAEWIATLDGDGQNDPADIPKLIEARDADRTGHLDLVAGHRRKRRDSWLKKVSSKIANAVRSRLLRDRTPDTGCGLKLFRRGAFLELPYFDHMHRFLAALIIRNGGEVESVEVNHRPRTRGVSKYGLHNRLWVGIVDLFGVMWLQRRAKLPVIGEKADD